MSFQFVQWCAQVEAHGPIPLKDQRLDQAIAYRVLPPEHTRRKDALGSAWRKTDFGA